MKYPLVSVLVPCYNAELYVEEAIDSILSQTYSNLEVIAIDDCSTDDTMNILNRIASKDKRVRVVKNDANLKLIKTLNKGIDLCTGEFIARMDSDDISLENRIEKQVHFLLNNLDYDIVGTLFNVFSTNKPNRFNLHINPLRDEDLRAYMLFKSGICHPSVMIRRHLFSDLGLRFEADYLHVEDYALWSKAIYQTKLANIGEPLLLYRVHQNQVSMLHNALQTENKKKVFEIHMQKLGVDITPESLSLHASVAECVPEKFGSIEFLQKCEAYIQMLLALNRKINFCNSEFLIKMMSVHWLRLCANSRLGKKTFFILKSSNLYDKRYYSQKDILILYAKVIFKIKYKKSEIYKLFFS